ncbi:tetratricopeptide repeat protein [Varunaivibrio sulfuroxidans]|nr:tetratricopeptide repeat-containing glycosyltransferase family protein [Varunaivibrio sulfuroxidans]WES29730.1 tetratricopeptide repeat-containing glycosyltransferase family protein [Varunaivibrio sulfuroxidans]
MPNNAPVESDVAEQRHPVRVQEARRLFAMASDHHRRGNLDEAVRGYSRSIALDPKVAEVFANLGAAMRAQGKREAAIACYRHALALNPDLEGVYINLCHVFRDLGRFEQAAVAGQKAVKISPHSRQAIFNMGLALRDLGRADVALGFFQQVLNAAPDFPECRLERAKTWLLKGNFEAGFADYDWREKVSPVSWGNTPKPRWQGQPLAGKTLLIHGEPTLGETLLFARFVPRAKKQGCRVLLESPAETARLLTGVDGVDEVIIAGTGVDDFDYHVSLGSLPALLKTDWAALATLTPYVRPPELHTIHVPTRENIQLKVGLVWNGAPDCEETAQDNCPFETFIDLMGVPRVAFFSLQGGEKAGDLHTHACAPLITDMGAIFDDLSDAAAAIAQLDLVITVNAPIAHLAGAMGRPVWLLAARRSDWFWMDGRADTPWYPSVRIFRQTQQNDWLQPMGAIRTALLEMSDKMMASLKGRKSAAAAGS